MVSISIFIISAILLFLIGLLIGGGITFYFMSKHQKNAQELAAEFSSSAGRKNARAGNVAQSGKRFLR